MTLDNFVEADILSTCNALGSEIKGVYEKGSDCIECLKDILRYLRKDSETHSILRYLGSVRLLQTDLIPIIKRYDKDKEIFDFTLRILVALTNPALLLYKEDLPDDKISRNLYLQIISYLQSYKKAFVDVNVWKILYEQLKELLKLRHIERSSNENLLIERIIILIRNVLHVPPDERRLKQTDDDLSLHDKILLSLHESKVDILLLYISANEEEHQFSLHVLEIISLMLREYTSETLASTNEIRSDIEKQKDLNVLLAARQREQSLRLQKIQSVSKPRFNGVYCVKNMKSISDKDYIAHKLITDVNDVKFDLQKSARRIPKNRARAPDVDNTRQSTVTIRMLLKNFCIEFLKTYNKMMVSVKRELLRKVSDDHDETYYLWAVCYFMQFNRLFHFKAALVSETISMQTFHHIQTQITNYHEMMMTDRKKTIFWAKRMQLGVSAYKELLETLRKMERSEDESIKDSADALISHVFYVIEYREMLISLLSHYDEVKFPLSYLAELVESSQLFLKMLENHSKKHSEVIVQKKLRKPNKRKKKKPVVIETVNEENQLNEQWGAITSLLSKALNNCWTIPEVSPFDGASDLSFEEQKVEVVYKIREAVIANEPIKAIGLLRAARELWPEGDSFGYANIEPEPEFMIIREIHFSNLKKSENPILENENNSDEEDEEAESMPSVAESTLEMDDVYKRYASPKVVQPCSLLLANYQKNKPQTNICLVKLLHRIAWNCKMHVLFFQSTIFLTFQKIFHDPDVNHDPVLKELYRFAKFIMQKFFSIVEKNNKIFVEFLFWKGAREAFEVEEGYGTSESKVKGWTEDDEEELKYLFEENKDIYIEGQDVADIILANFEKRNRTKPQIISALKRLHLINSVKDLKPGQRSQWVEMEIVELQHLFEDYKDYDDVVGCIVEKLSIKRSRKAVIDKLLELNLIQDRSDMKPKKKRQWVEMEIIELQHLFGKYKNSDDVMGCILDKLSIKRSRKAVVDKLLELNLIQDRKEVRKRTSKKKSGSGVSDGNSSDESDDFLDDADANDEQKYDSAPSDENETNFFRSKHLADSNSLQNAENIKEDGVNKFKGKQNYDSAASDEDEINFFKNLEAERLADSLQDAKNTTEDDDSLFVSESSSEGKKQNAHKSGKGKNKIFEIWDESEVMELTSLFHESQDMHVILNKLTVKRPKWEVVGKLLELGLIKDKNELTKSRVSKSKKRNMVHLSKFDVHSDNLSDIENSNNVQKEVLKEKKKMMRRILSDSSDEDLPLSHNSLLTNSKENKNNTGKPKKQPKIWEELEIVKLTHLFLEHKDSDDVMAAILKGLIVKRTQKDIIGKLIETGLIQDKKEIKKKKSTPGSNALKLKRKKITDVWEENEIIELNQLYEEGKSHNDIMSHILNGLTIKRSKQDVIEKLLQVGLISDKKEIKKKQVTKPSKKNKIMSDNYSDEDPSETNAISSKGKNKKAKKKKIANNYNSDEDLSETNTISQKKKHEKSILSESSDDDDLPLCHTISLSNSKDDADDSNVDASLKEMDTSLYDGISTVANLSTKETVFLDNNILKMSDKNSSMASKRKRLMISSDDSSDSGGDALIINEDLNDSNLPNVTDLITDNIEESLEERDAPKKQKKRLRVLIDSDDSS